MAGSINRTNQSLDQYLQQKLAKLESEFLQFKNAHPIGSDSVLLQKTPTTPATLAPLTIAAGATAGAAIQFSSADAGGLSNVIWNFRASLYIDGNTTHDIYPMGFNMTAGMLKSFFSVWMDSANSDILIDDSPVVTFICRIQNNDSVSHQYYIQYQGVFPTQAGIAAL